MRRSERPPPLLLASTQSSHQNCCLGLEPSSLKPLFLSFAPAAFDDVGVQVDNVVPVKGVLQFMYNVLLPEGRQAALSIMPKKRKERGVHEVPKDLRPSLVGLPSEGQLAVFGTKVDPNKIKKQKKLGAGGQCIAWLATYQGVQCVAKIPRASIDRETRRMMMDAAKMQQTIKHPCVGHVFGMCTQDRKEVPRHCTAPSPQSGGGCVLWG